MPATTAAVSAGDPRRGLARLLPRVFVFLWVLGFLLVTVLRGPVLLDAWTRHWADLLFWLLLVLLVDLFPVAVGDQLLTLDLPLLLAAAFLFSPEAAASVALIGALDRRELAGEVTLQRALLNRTQIAVSVLCAGYVFHAIGGGSGLWWRSLMGVVLALMVDYVINIILVSSITILRLPGGPGRAFRRVLSGLRIGNWHQFLLSYLGYGTLAFGLSRLYVNPGAWAVVMLLTPIVVARQALVRTQQLERATTELQEQKHLLSRALDQIVEERRDERTLIAGELHDDVLQHVLHTQLAALTMAERTGSSADRRELAEVVEASGDAMVALRGVIRGLRRSPLGREGLVPALRQLLAMLGNEWGREIESGFPDDLSLAPDAQLVAYQGAREGVINALKHANAGSISLRLEESGPQARLVVRDDGRGFDPGSSEGGQHFGLELLRERVSSVGGGMTIDSEPGKGTRLEVCLPTRASSLHGQA